MTRRQRKGCRGCPAHRRRRRRGQRTWPVRRGAIRGRTELGRSTHSCPASPARARRRGTSAGTQQLYACRQSRRRHAAGPTVSSYRAIRRAAAGPGRSNCSSHGRDGGYGAITDSDWLSRARNGSITIQTKQAPAFAKASAGQAAGKDSSLVRPLLLPRYCE